MIDKDIIFRLMRKARYAYVHYDQSGHRFDLDEMNDKSIKGQRAIEKLERIRLCMIEFNEFTAREKVKELKEILAEEG